VKMYRSERPVKPRRPMRRSMAELAASLQSAASEKSPLERPLDTGEVVGSIPTAPTSEKPNNTACFRVGAKTPNGNSRQNTHCATLQNTHCATLMASRVREGRKG